MLLDVTGSWLCGVCDSCRTAWMFRTNADSPTAEPLSHCPRCHQRDAVRWGWVRIENASITDGDLPPLIN